MSSQLGAWWLSVALGNTTVLHHPRGSEYRSRDCNPLKVGGAVFHMPVLHPSVRAFPVTQIGVILRDSNGIAQVNAVTGSKILRLLKANGENKHTRPLAPDFAVKGARSSSSLGILCSFE